MEIPLHSLLYKFAVSVLISWWLQTKIYSQVIPVNEPILNKPTLFFDIADSIPVAPIKLLQLFTYPVGTNIDISFSDSFPFRGTLRSRSEKFGGSLKSIIVNSSNRNGSHLQISIITNPDGTASFKGRIISPDHDDGFILFDKDGLYWLKKIKMANLLIE
jgi:hypothetical protein